MEEVTGTRFAVVRLRLSKGDLMYIEPLAFFDDLAAAQAELGVCLATKEHGFRWSDWDEYEIRVYRAGKDCGPVSQFPELLE